MIYREAGQFRTSYAADQAVFQILQDRFLVWAVAFVAFFVVPFFASEYLLRAILVPFLVLTIAAIGLTCSSAIAARSRWGALRSWRCARTGAPSSSRICPDRTRSPPL